MEIITLIKFFGTVNLIERLSRAKWMACSGGGLNFDAINLGGYCLTKPADDLCSTPYKVKIESKNGDSFVVQGFGFRGIPYAVVLGPPIYEKNEILGEVLMQDPEENLIEYTLSISSL